ncbi:MAG: hypothetical protein IJZ47_10400 [Oscillospiraceae bacterium]|nr:hypothetical protein [Oscillospiraceae bacterium]
MGFFSKLFGSKEKSKFTFIKDIAAIICGGDTNVLKAIDDMLSNPKKYFKRNSDRYDDRGIDAEEIQDIMADGDADEQAELFWLGMVDELIEGGYVAELDYKCSKDELLNALSELNYPTLKNTVGSTDMLSSAADDISTLCNEISKLMAGTAKIGYIDIDSDSYPLFILTAAKGKSPDELLDQLTTIAGDNLFNITTP